MYFQRCDLAGFKTEDKLKFDGEQALSPALDALLKWAALREKRLSVLCPSLVLRGE
jgi:hypothetical protein